MLAFTHLLRAGAIDADLDLFHGHTATDWARFGPGAIRSSDFVLVAVSPTWRRAWEGAIEPDRSAGVVGEANELRGLFAESRQEFLERVIPVLLPGRGESDIPTDLRSTSHWVRVPTLDEQGMEDLYRRLTGQPAYPKPPLGTRRTLSPRTSSVGVAEARGRETRERTDSQEEIRYRIDRADSALADMPSVSRGAGEAPWDKARRSVEARRQALLRELAQVTRLDGGAQGRRSIPSWLRFWQPGVRVLDRRFVVELAIFAVLFILPYAIGVKL